MKEAIIQYVVQNPIDFVVSIIGAVLLLVAFIAITIKLIIKIAKLIKEGKWSELADSLLDYIKSAETLVTDGKTKLEVALAKARTFCAEHKLEYDEQKVISLIEKDIEFSKTVNAHEVEEDIENEQINDSSTEEILEK